MTQLLVKGKLLSGTTYWRWTYAHSVTQPYPWTHSIGMHMNEIFHCTVPLWFGQFSDWKFYSTKYYWHKSSFKNIKLCVRLVLLTSIFSKDDFSIIPVFNRSHENIKYKFPPNARIKNQFPIKIMAKKDCCRVTHHPSLPGTFLRHGIFRTRTRKDQDKPKWVWGKPSFVSVPLLSPIKRKKLHSIFVWTMIT